MGNINSASEDSNGIHQAPVLLNIYDLTPINNYTRCVGLGIFHSGIEVHGLEYGFGAHDYSASGVFEVEPKRCPGFIFRCSVPLGFTTMTPTEFRAFMENIASEYHGDTYHLITKNCNHFTEDMALRLTGKEIPGWVNRLARIGVMCSCLLPESLQVTQVKQSQDYQGCSGEEGSETQSLSSQSTITQQDTAESDDTDQDKHLLSPTTTGGVEMAFIREAQSQIHR